MTAKRARMVKAQKAGHKLRQSRRVILWGEEIGQRLTRQYAESESAAFWGRVTSVRSDGLVFLETTALPPEKKPGGVV